MCKGGDEYYQRNSFKKDIMCGCMAVCVHECICKVPYIWVCGCLYRDVYACKVPDISQ